MPLHSRKMIGIIVTPGAVRKQVGPPELSLFKLYKETVQKMKESDGEDPEVDSEKDPQDWLRDPDPAHEPELDKVAVPQGWNRGNKVRSTMAVGSRAGHMNNGDAYPDYAKDLGWGDGNERTEEQMD